MPVIELQTTINRPLFEVYQAATDFEEMVGYIPFIHHVDIIAGKPLRAGSMVTMQRQQMGSRILVNADMVEVERNKSLEMTGIWGRFPFRRRVEFASTGRETQIKDRLTIKTGFLFFWYAPILSRALKSQLKQEWTYFQA